MKIKDDGLLMYFARFSSDNVPDRMNKCIFLWRVLLGLLGFTLVYGGCSILVLMYIYGGYALTVEEMRVAFEVGESKGFFVFCIVIFICINVIVGIIGLITASIWIPRINDKIERCLHKSCNQKIDIERKKV